MPAFATIGQDSQDIYGQLRHIGFRKIWKIHDFAELNYANFIQTGYDEKVGFFFDPEAFQIQLLNVMIIFSIMLQSEIFDSAGYKKFITQSDGSMDLLM